MNSIEERVRELRRIIEQSREAVKVTYYDFEDSASSKELQKYSDSVFKSRISLIKGYGQRKPSEFTHDILTRRKDAVFELAKKAQRRYSDRFPRLSIARCLTKLCAPCPSGTFDELNDTYHIELAAAIWMLDHLRRNDKLDEALSYLPQSRGELDSVELPNVTDSVHCDDLLRAMVYLIHFRNRGIVGFDENRAFIDDAATGRTARADAERESDISRFDAVMRLIDSDEIEKIREDFLRDVNSLTDSCMEILAELNDRLISLTDEKIGIIEGEIAKGERTAQSSITQTAPDDNVSSTFTVKKSEVNNGPAIEEELQKVGYQAETFCMSVMLLTPEGCHEVRELLGERLYSHISMPEPRDPFAGCFGFLDLLDTDSDEIWGYNIPYAVLANLCCLLPWAEALSRTDESEPSVTPEFYKAATTDPEKYIVPSEKSILNQRMISRPFVNKRDDKITFSQLTFLMSGLIPPRGMPERSYIKALFDENLSGSEVDILYEYFTLACSVARRDEDYVFIDEDDEDSAQPSDEEYKTDDNEKELRELKRENKNLKSVINKLEHRLIESSEALKSTEEKLDEASAELAELRSMIRRADKAEVDYTTAVEFPYTAQKRAVVFGGHESWSKAIRPLLPNVRFVEASALPNTGLIMNADVVWIQTNALSHSSFYKIIDVVRKHNIELRYFKYAGAEKCAEQFAMDDMAMADTDADE